MIDALLLAAYACGALIAGLLVMSAILHGLAWLCRRDGERIFAAPGVIYTRKKDRITADVKVPNFDPRNLGFRIDRFEFHGSKTEVAAAWARLKSGGPLEAGRDRITGLAIAAGSARPPAAAVRLQLNEE